MFSLLECRVLFRNGCKQRHGGPGTSGGRDPLVMYVRIAGVKKRLDRMASTCHVPATVPALSLEQKVNSTLVGSMAGGSASEMEA